MMLALLGFILISAYAQDSVREAANTAVAVLGGRDLNPYIECNDDPNVSRLQQVINEPTSRARSSCPAPVGPAQHRLMHRRDGYQSGNYLFKNLGNNRYRAVMNIKFESTTPGLAESMRARTINCMREMSPYLLGPGKELDIQILSPEETRQLPRDQRPDPYTVNVTRERKNYRGNANNYGSNFQCATIGHEILHFLGLCDEYYEGIKDETSNEAGRYIDWRCRAVTSEPSYMRNMLYAFQSAIPQTSRCECNEQCQRIMRHSPEARRLYLGMNGEDYLNTEMSVMDNHIVGFDANRNPIRRQICRFVETPNLGPGVIPRAPFELDSEIGNKYVFKSYEAYYRLAPGYPENHNFLWFGVKTYECNCPAGEGNNYCRRLMEQMKQRTREYHPRVTCPIGASPLANAPSIGYQQVSDPLQCEGSNCTLVMTSRGNGRPLLLPQQFERIAAGDCRGGAASAYERCETFATMGRNRPNRDYSMRIPENTNENQCAVLPPQCNDDRYFLHGQTSSTTAQ